MSDEIVNKVTKPLKRAFTILNRKILIRQNLYVKYDKSSDLTLSYIQFFKKWVLVHQDGHKGNNQKNLRWQIQEGIN